MGAEIGTALRDARIRRDLEIDDAEAATKIRGRYLSALEGEEWDVLPGGAYTRAFIRTYGNYLGLDGERLADRYRASGADPRPGPIEEGEGRMSGYAIAAIIAAALFVILIAVVFASGGAGA